MRTRAPGKVSELRLGTASRGKGRKLLLVPGLLSAEERGWSKATFPSQLTWYVLELAELEPSASTLGWGTSSQMGSG